MTSLMPVFIFACSVLFLIGSDYGSYCSSVEQSYQIFTSTSLLLHWSMLIGGLIQHFFRSNTLSLSLSAFSNYTLTEMTMFDRQKQFARTSYSNL